MSYYDESYPPSLWQTPTIPSDGRDTAGNGETFTDPAITAQDATNAAKLSGLGFVADPVTAWTTGQSMTVNTFRFHWNGTAWVAGLATAMEEGTMNTPKPDEPVDPTEPGDDPTAPESPPEGE